MKVCPICRITALEGEQIICPKCKADSPFTLLEGYSPVKKISDELKKIDGYKARIQKQRLYLYGLAALLLLALGYAFILQPLLDTNQGSGTSVVEVENPLNHLLQKQVDSLEGTIEKQSAAMELLKKRPSEADEKREDQTSRENARLEEELANVQIELAVLSKASEKHIITIQELESDRDALKKEIAQLKSAPKQKVVEGHGAQTTTHIVQEGESMYAIARKYYGNGMKYEKIAKDNNISDPSSIVNGQKLLIYQ